MARFSWHRPQLAQRTTLMIAVMAVLIPLTAGCATLPTSSFPSPVDRVEVSQPVDYVITPAGPKTGASATDIVAGFLRAGVGAADNYGVARSYIVGDDAVQWRPESSVLVTDKEPTVSAVSDTSIRATIDVVGTLSQNGVYTAFRSPHHQTLMVKVKKEDGQWRISDPQDGTVVVRTDFQKVFRQRALYFPSNDDKQLIPDIRWFPNSAATPARIVTALLSTPATWLVSSVTSAFPTSTKLAADTVTVSGGTASISLSSDALQTSSLSLMQAQMEASLRGVSGINKVQLSVNSTTINAKSSDAKIASAANTIANDTLVSFARRVETLDTTTQGTASAAPTSVNLQNVVSSARRGTRSAFATSEKLMLRVGNGAITTLATGQFTNVNIDVYGVVWALHDKKLVYFNGMKKGSVKGLGDIVTYALAPDGTRFVYVDAKDASQLWIAALRRDPTNTATVSSNAVDKSSLIVKTDGTVSAVGWSGVGSLITAATVDGTDRVTIYGLNGAADAVAAPGKVEQLVAGNSADTVRLLLANGSVLALRGTGWVSSATHAIGLGLVW